MRKILEKLTGALENFWKRKTISLDKIPESFYIGQDYVEDPAKTRHGIEVWFYSPAALKPVRLEYTGGYIFVERRGSMIRVAFWEILSNKLVSDIRKKHKGDEWILGYINKVLPYVNQEVLRQRYSMGHTLAKTFSVFDIYKIDIRMSTGKSVPVRTHGAVAEFPELQGLVGDNPPIHIADLVDSIHAYFSGNYDDCVRRAITSIENSFDYYGFKQADEAGKKIKFEKIITQNIDITCHMINKSVGELIISAYETRNKIVHEGYRIPPTEKMLCKNAIHGVWDFYKQFGNNESLKKYALFLEGQFLMCETFIGDQLTLERLQMLQEKELKLKNKAIPKNSP